MIDLHCGDCVEIMQSIPDSSVDLVVCDLPYGTTSISWDTVIPFDQMWSSYNRVCKKTAAIILFGSQPFTTDLIMSNRRDFRYSLVWNKNVPTGMATARYRPMKYHEDILIFYRQQPTYNPIMKPRVGVGKDCYKYDHYCGDSNHITMNKVKRRYDPDLVQPSTVLSFNVVPNRKGKLHPTQKPVELMEYLIRTYSNPGDTVLDNCMGSGTTGVAAQNAQRKFIGIEKDSSYYEISRQRILTPAIIINDSNDNLT